MHFSNSEPQDYKYELQRLQLELVHFLAHVRAARERVAIVFEGRDTAGKGGAILRFRRHLNPRYARTVALPPPSEEERGQWYFQRYMRHLPNRGEIVFFDRSWYNRAVVEPVLGFCTPEEYERFLDQVVHLERMLIEDGIQLIKLWFSIDPGEQAKRLEARAESPLKKWKLSTTDMLAQERWQEFTRHKLAMYRRTHTAISPWVVVDGNRKQVARLESIRYVLSRFDYPEKGASGACLEPDPEVVRHCDPETER